MKEGRMFSDVYDAKTVVPTWLSPFIALVFVLLGQLVGAILLGVVLGSLLLMLPAPGSQGTNILTGMGSLPIQIADLFLCFALALFVL